MKDLFVVELAVEAFFTALKTSNPAYAKIISIFQPLIAAFLRFILGFMVEKGVVALDLGWYSLDLGRERKEYRATIEKIYAKALARKYTEEEKNAIRQQYLETLRRFATVSERV